MIPTIEDERFQSVWTEAMDYYNLKLKKPRLPAISFGDPWGKTTTQIPATFEEVKKMVMETFDLTSRRKSIAAPGFWDRLEQFFISFQQYAVVIDVMIQRNAEQTALIWGSIRLLMTLIARNIELRAVLGDALIDVLHYLSLWEGYVQIFEGRPKVNELVVPVFAHIIHFLRRCLVHLQRSRRWWKRLGTCFRITYPEKLNKIIRDMEDAHRKALENMTATDRREMHKLASDQADRHAAEYRKNDKFRTVALSVYDYLKKHTEIQGDVLQLVQGHMEMERRANMVRQWLNVELPTSRNNLEATSSTCEWIFKKSEFVEWLSPTSSRLLWITGPAGCGKSVLAGVLSSRRRDQFSQGQSLFYYFYHRDVERSSSGVTMAISLISDILRQLELDTATMIPYQQALSALIAEQKYYNSASDLGSKNFSALWKLLGTMLHFLGSAPSYLVIDALDEADKLSKSISWDQILMDVPSLRIVILSRDYECLSATLQASIRLRIRSDDVRPDILKYTEDHIAFNAKTCGPLADQIRERVKSESEGIFLWVILLLQGLSDANTLADRRRRLMDQPQKLMDAFRVYDEECTASMDELGRRRRLQTLRMLVGVRRLLTIGELYAALAHLNGEDLDSISVEDQRTSINKICRPFVSFTAKDEVYLMHPSVREFLLSKSFQDCFNLQVSNADISTACLRSLLQVEAKSMDFITELIQENIYDFVPSTVVATNSEARGSKLDVSYKYAAEFWDTHLLTLSTPVDSTILELLSQFLGGLEFVTWSEMRFRSIGQHEFDAALEVRASLYDWLSETPSVIEEIGLDRYLEAPYELAANSMPRDNQSRENSDYYLIKYRLTDFISWVYRRSVQVVQLRHEIAKGLQRTLGERHAFTIHADLKLGQALLICGTFDQAETHFEKTLKIARDVIGKDNVNVYSSTNFLGLSKYHQTYFEEAIHDLQIARKNLIRLKGDTYDHSIHSLLYLGWCYDQQLKIKEARKFFEEAREALSMLRGDSHSGIDAAYATNEVCYATCLRKFGEFSEAEKCLKDALEIKLRLFPLGITHFDTVLSEAYVVRDQCRYDEASQLVDSLMSYKCMAVDFHRYCQAWHLKALLCADKGQILEATSILKMTLEELSDSSKAREDNRELLWIRLSLARLMESLDEPEDRVYSLFTNLTRRTLQSIEPENDAERLEELRITRRALEGVRRAQFEGSNQLLQSQGLSWVRPKTFWILVGGPSADTAYVPSPA